MPCGVAGSEGTWNSRAGDSRMSMEMRAAQFAPYAALSGHAGAIIKTAKFAELRMQRVIEPNIDDGLFIGVE